MSKKSERPNTREGESPKSLSGDGKETVAIALPDDALAEHGFERGRRVEIEIGEMRQGDLGAVLRRDGRWFAGYVFFAECGLRVLGATPEYIPKYIPLDEVVTHGRVVRYRGRRLSARRLLSIRGVGGIRFRFKV